MTERTAITGLGMITACGIGPDAFLESILQGRSGISAVDLFPGPVPPGNVGGQCKDFNDLTIKKQYLKAQRKSIKVMCRDIQLGVAAASIAMTHSGLELNEEERSRLGVEFGADLMLSPPDVLARATFAARNEQGNPTDTIWGEKGIAQMEPLWLLKYLPNMPACHISIHADARGPSNSLTLEEVSGILALGESLRIIRRGQADAMIAGTTGARLNVIKSINYMAMHELAEPGNLAPEEVLKPFDKQRNGEVVGEGSCAMILEREGLAKKRGANIYGWILGVGSSCVRTPREGGNPRAALVNAIKMAMKHSHISYDQIGHINANGCGSQSMDAAEAAAIHEVFGSLGNQVPVTAMKPYFGNCGAGTGTIEVAASLLAMTQGVVPHTLNYSTPDEECDLNIVHTEPLKTDKKHFLKLNVSRTGRASAMVIESV
ncbi:MAG: beta-ketoacyl-[acyl-carrier-protein] synthase family protein [Planctomycetaceae bacterium]|nr:beta-ketoacyl-[acyl-carrier-protein] synthase family protein [Planctomycetaceae bacterium]